MAAQSLPEMDAQLMGLAEAFIAVHRRRPEQADIAADGAWHALFQAKRALERREAGDPLPGGCSVYIVRRRRYCTHAAADGLGGLCSEHGGAGAAALKLPTRVLEPDALARAQDKGWTLKRNLKRRMKVRHAEWRLSCDAPLAWRLTCDAPPCLLLRSA
jgi:hypothetical protein